MRGMKSVPCWSGVKGNMLIIYVASCKLIYMECTHEQRSVALIVYHIIWCPKRRRKVLQGRVADRLEQLIHEVVNEIAWQVIQVAIQPDHVLLFIRSSPCPLPTDI